LVAKLNPEAEVLTSNYGNISLKKIINTKKFNFEKAQNSAGWMRELLKPSHTPETEKYGIRIWIYRRSRPFHPKRFYNFLIGMEDDENHLFKACIRAKGTVWLASRHLHSFQFQKAGALFEFEPLDLWYAEVPIEKWGENEEEIKEMKDFLKRTWTEPYGDR
jgi:G3E family GTPase